MMSDDAEDARDEQELFDIKYGHNPHILGARPRSEIDEMFARVDQLTKYNLLRANYMILAQSYHGLCQLIISTAHTGKRFQDCQDATCKELCKALEITKL
jgi:hypothetical protein